MVIWKREELRRIRDIGDKIYMGVCVCVCEREREIINFKLFKFSQTFNTFQQTLTLFTFVYL